MASVQQIHAMKERHIKIAVVCQSKNYVVFDNELVLPIYGWLDEQRRPTDNLEIARYYEFGDDEHGHGIGDIDQYEMPSYVDH